MPKPPDPVRILDALPADDRRVVMRWLGVMGLAPDELACCPPLRQLVEMVAVLQLVRAMPGVPRETAFQQAAAILSTRDLSRTWYRWQARAVRQFVGDDDAAA